MEDEIVMNITKQDKIPLRSGSFLPIILLCGLVIAGGCAKEPASKTSIEVPPIPEQAIEQFTVTETEAGTPHWVLNATSAQINDITKKAVLQFPQIKFYEKGAYVSTLVAARGVINTQNYDIMGEGACTLDTAKGEHLDTSDLRYKSDTKRITTDAPVKLIKTDEIIYGTGMEATPDLETIIIKKQRVEMRHREESK
ncbi:MAG: LPS export ABC transporter periplasmic protein LptC [Elusimicrobia bacterium]|nr:LPS export ABC transporter periplasmic protein LptC [Elusimicrobiota bacterium]